MESSPKAFQGCPLSPFLFNFVIDEIMKWTLDGLQNPGVRIMTGENLVDLDDIVLPFEELQQAQSVNHRAFEFCENVEKLYQKL